MAQGRERRCTSWRPPATQHRLCQHAASGAGSAPGIALNGSPDIAHPTALDRGTLVVAGVALLGPFMTLIDTTAVIVALDALAAEFGVSLATIQWVATAYTLALAAVFPFTGWASDRFGTRQVFLAGLIVFALGSALCSFAWSAGSLVAFRVLQGVGGGLLLPAVTTIVARKAGPRRRGRVMGILGVPLVLAPIFGPVLGGWLVDESSWRLIFLLNLPIALVAGGLAHLVLAREEPRPQQRLDWLGIVLLSPGLTLALFGLAESAELGFAAFRAWAPALAGCGLVAAFLVHAWRSPAALIDVRRLAHSLSGAAAATLLLGTTAIFGALLLIPLYYQTVRGASAFEAGLLLAPWGFGVMVMLPVGGWLSDRWRPGLLPFAGLLAMVAGMVPYVLLGADTSIALLCVAGFAIGLGDGLVFVPATSLVLALSPQRLLARTSMALSIITESAASIGTATVSVLLASSLPVQLLGHHSLGAHVPVAGERLADGFGSAFAWMTALLVFAMLPAGLLALRASARVGDGPGGGLDLGQVARLANRAETEPSGAVDA